MTTTWLQAIQLINILLSAQNHRGDLIIQDQQRQVQRTLDQTQLYAKTVKILLTRLKNFSALKRELYALLIL